MNNREAKQRRLRAKRVAAKAAQPVLMKRAGYIKGGTAEGAARHARHVARAGGSAVCTAPEPRWFGDRKCYESPIKVINTAPVQAWLDERVGRR